jgi:hypothetical protein
MPERLHSREVQWAVAILMVGVLGAAGARFLWHAMQARPHFALREVTVVGADRVPSHEIRDLARVPIGTNTWAVDLDAVRRRVQRHSWVRNVRVQRSLPDCVIVEIREHRDIAAVVSADGTYAVDRRGRVITSLRTQPTDLPWIRGIATDDLATGNPRVANELRQAATLIRTFSRFHRVAGLEVDPVAGLTVRSVQLPDVPVAFGWGDWKHKRQRLDAVLALWGDRPDEIRTISVVFEDNVVVELHDPSRAALPSA